MINITAAEYLDCYRIRLIFDDSKKQVVDFMPFLCQAIHPDIRAYLDLAKFIAFRVEHGELVWGDFDLCFPMIDLYNNQILHAEADRIAA